jgi:peptidoglycan/xylan/chitin deacetylase (PgdA/CDA1 family)
MIIGRIMEKYGVSVPRDFADKMYLSWHDVKKMENLVDFGSHSLNHPRLTLENAETIKQEIEESKKIIEGKTGRKVTSFCYPNGMRQDYNDIVIDTLTDNGFLLAVTAINGRIRKQDYPFRLRRVPVDYDDDMLDFEFKFTFIYNVLRYLNNLTK